MKDRFYDLHAHSFFSCGTDSPTRLILHAKRLGWHGLAITDYHPVNLNLFEKIESIMKKTFSNFDVIIGVEIKTEKISELKTALNKLRPIADVILVNSQDIKVIRAATKDSRVDIIAQENFTKEKIDPTLFKFAAKSKVCFEINLRNLLQSQGAHRTHLFKLISKEIHLVRKFGAKIVITNGACSWLDIRAPLEIIALAKCLGLSKEEALSAISKVPYEIISLNREKRKPDFIMKGIKIIKKGV
ncbi:MAG: PHP domain-containing protein [Euryarchaeota archaeon]|nr:PHP domain-containing protein [Euryarchaeota archaeon]